MLQPAFDLVNTLHRAQVHRIHGQAVKGIRGHADDAAGAQTGNDIFHAIRFRLIRMDAKDLC
jgi:predicted NUDIX family phosphoesterase